MMSKTKTLMTCRESVFRNKIVLKAQFMSHEKHLIQLSTDANALTAGDRHKLLVMYTLDIYVCASGATYARNIQNVPNVV